MTQNSFLRLLRQYAALSQRYRRSYAEAVNAIVQSRHDAILKEALPADQTAAAVETMSDQAKREYGAVDRDFKVDFIPF
jgi:archaellum biogenesis protein FlaJ (TadC family)